MEKRIKGCAAAGICTEAVYFLSVALFLGTQAGRALTFWELMTAAGAFAMTGIFVFLNVSAARTVASSFALACGR